MDCCEPWVLRFSAIPAVKPSPALTGTRTSIHRDDDVSERSYTVFLSLQARPNAAHGTETREIEAPSWSSERSGLHCTEEVRILVMDDDDQICRLIEGTLAPSGFLIDTIS